MDTLEFGQVLPRIHETEQLANDEKKKLSEVWWVVGGGW